MVIRCFTIIKKVSFTHLLERLSQIPSGEIQLLEHWFIGWLLFDISLAKTINGLYKAELIHRPALWGSKDSLELANLEWVSKFNHLKLPAPIG